MSTIFNIPTEILLKIFTYLGGKDLETCSAVCSHWEDLVEGLGEKFWKQLCAIENGKVYEEAHRKSNLSWRELHRSLSLWPDVGRATTSIGAVPARETENMYVLKNSIISCSQKSESCPSGLFDTIMYYNSETGEITRKMNGIAFSLYAENDDIIAMVFAKNKVSVIRVISKANEDCTFDAAYNKRYPWMVLGKEMFYTNPTEGGFQLFCVKLLDDGTFKCEVLCEDMGGTLYEVAYDNGQLYVYVLDATTYPITVKLTRLVGSKLIFECNYECAPRERRFKPLQLIKVYGHDWTITDMFKLYSNQYEHEKCVYGDTVVTISTPSLLNVYDDEYGLYDGTDFHLEFMKLNLSIDLDFWIDENYFNFGKVEIVEIVNGHKIIILYNGRIHIFILKHDDGMLELSDDDSIEEAFINQSVPGPSPDSENNVINADQE